MNKKLLHNFVQNFTKIYLNNFIVLAQIDNSMHQKCDYYFNRFFFGKICFITFQKNQKFNLVAQK